ncbi:cytosine permease [Paenarthrobacter sp. Z7-10]|uniref:purine-cytosine permease family protein n=1 Tax=Paenarthrobacter sp. Z7-10 TaxID=2787635 RepID=UPI0022A9F350|nr:cytosine permease [Paenarthrobacter sp. Z7-10]MCZ2401845.1 cytosine permease [Paenarthrobacter sp. Z7-10]
MASTGPATGSSGTLLETHSIDVVPETARHGRPRNQFTLWFGANMQITAVVTGALAVTFGADALWGILGLLAGNLLGGAVMALHSAQGPKLGLPQMISSRAQFGVYGAVIPLILVILMYLGFASTGAILAGQAVNTITGSSNVPLGIIVFGAITAVVATLGYKYIHLLGRIATVSGLVGFTYLAVRLFTQYDVGALFGTTAFSAASFLTAVALSAGWQLTYGPYVADYSRYLPADTPAKSTFIATFSGSVIGSQWSMSFGALLAALPAAADGSGFLDSQVGFLAQLGGGGIFAVLIALVVFVGKLTVNTLNAYGGFMSILTSISAFTGKSKIRQLSRILYICGFILLSVLIAIMASSDFLGNFKNLVLLLLMVFIPWSAINLVDYYLISRERVDVAALYDPNGHYGRWNKVALISYAIGIAVQIPFLSQSLYTGPIATAMSGTDISWLVGLLVTAGIFYPWAKRAAVAKRIQRAAEPDLPVSTASRPSAT